MAYDLRDDVVKILSPFVIDDLSNIICDYLEYAPSQFDIMKREEVNHYIKVMGMLFKTGISVKQKTNRLNVHMCHIYGGYRSEEYTQLIEQNHKSWHPGRWWDWNGRSYRMRRN